MQKRKWDFALNIPKEILEILNKLNSQTASAYLVGGCVRDFLLKRETLDFDITTGHTPEKVMEILKDYNLVLTGIKYGTVTLTLAPYNVEITTFRSEGEYSDSRHPQNVKFEKSLKADLARRDFTVNAIAYNEKEGFVDLFGGMSDIKNKVLRAVGDADTRISEDALRILRALRFKSTLGFEIDESLKAAILKNHKLINKLSAERIFSETKKLINGDFADSVFSEYGEILSPLFFFEKPSNKAFFEASKHLSRLSGTCLRLSLLFRFNALSDVNFYSFEALEPLKRRGKTTASYLEAQKNAESALNALKSNNDTKRKVLKSLMALPIMESKTEVLLFLSDFEYSDFLDLISLEYAVLGTSLSYFEKEELDFIYKTAKEAFENGEIINTASLKINGYDLLKLKFTGKEIKDTLKKLRYEVILKKTQNNHSALLKRAKEIRGGEK